MQLEIECSISRASKSENKTTSNMPRVSTPNEDGITVAMVSHDSTLAPVAPPRKVEIEKKCTTTSSALSVIQRPTEAWLRIGMMASPFRNFLGLLKPPPLNSAGSSLLSSSDPESPRASTSDSATEIERLSLLKRDISSSSSSSSVLRREGQGVVMVAFNANVKEISHAGILWAMEHILKRGDTLTIVSVLDSVRGPLGYRVKIGDHNQKLAEEEVRQTLDLWRSFPELDRRCTEAGVKLVVIVKATQQGELAICREAMQLRACHVVLDSSLKNRRREFYLQNLSCNVTRIRRHGGVDVIRPSLNVAVVRRMKVPRSPTSVLPPPRLSYGDQIDEFEINLGFLKPRRPISNMPKSFPRIPSAKYSSEKSKLSSSAHEHEISSSMSTSSVPSFVSAPSFTSSSNDDMDDDLFSIFHGSTRHTEINTDLFSSVNLSSYGYESDDLFSIGNASSRLSAQAASPLPEFQHHHSHQLSFSTLPLLCEPLEAGECTSSVKE